MKFKQKVFIVISMLLILGVSGAIYVNYKLDNLVARLNQPGVMYRETETPGSNAGGDVVSGSESGKTGSNSQTGVPGAPDGESGSSAGVSNSRPTNDDIVKGAASKANRPVEKGDLIKAGLIIIRRLDADEISYMYEVGMKEHQSAEDLAQVRKILKKKLTPEEIDEMQYLGEKYGRSLKFLD